MKTAEERLDNLEKLLVDQKGRCSTIFEQIGELRTENIALKKRIRALENNDMTNLFKY